MSRSRLETTPIQQPSPEKDNFTSFSRVLTTSPAFNELKGIELRLYMALAIRHDGYNNGKIVLGARDAAKELRVSKNTVLPCFRRLVELGLIIRRVKGEIYLDKTGKVSADSERIASEWEITDYNTWEDTTQVPAKRTYMDWCPKTGQIVEGSRPKNLPKPRMNGTTITPPPAPKPVVAKKTRQASASAQPEPSLADDEMAITTFDDPPKPRPDPVDAFKAAGFEVIEYDSIARNKLYAAEPEDIPF